MPELMSFPPWQTASALLRLRYVTRRWGWVGARQGGEARRAGGRVPAWSQNSVYFFFFAKEGRVTGSAEHQTRQGKCSFQDLNFSKALCSQRYCGRCSCRMPFLLGLRQVTEPVVRGLGSEREEGGSLLIALLLWVEGAF